MVKVRNPTVAQVCGDRRIRRPALVMVRRSVPAVIAAVAVIAAWLGLLYHLSWRVPFDSDHANTVLAGHGLMGNPLLRGWVLPGDPYWLTCLPVYGLVAGLFGPGPVTMHAAPALLSGGLIAAACWVTGQNGGGHRHWVATALVVLLIGLPHPVLARFLFTNLHVATIVECLIGGALLAHHPRRAAWWAGVVLLAAAVVSDPFGVTIGVLPVACAGAAAGLRQRRWAPFFSAGAAASLAGVAAPIVRLALRAAGGFGLAPALPLAPSSYRFGNLGAIPEVLGALLGVGPGGGLSGTAAAARAVGATLFILGIAVAAVRLLLSLISGPGRAEQPGSSPAASDWVDDFLLAGTFGGLATFVFATLPPRDIGSTRYLTSALIYGTVLAGRQLAWVVDRLGVPARKAVGIAVLTLGLGYLLAPMAALGDPRATNPGRELVAWLSANDLRAGYGPYWMASIVTVESGGAIPVRPVTAVDGRLRGYLYYSTREWFSRSPRPGRWFVAYDANPWGVDEHTARATFGPPTMTVEHGAYRILIWDHDLSPHLGPAYRDPERT